MKILILTSSFPRFKGDFAGSFIFDFSLNLKKKGFEVEVLAPSFNEIRNSYEIWNGVEISRSGENLLKFFQTPFYGDGLMENIKNNPLNILKLSLFLPSLFIKGLKSAYSSDLILSNWLFPMGFIGSLISLITGKKHILYVHSIEPFMLEKFFNIFWYFFIKSSSNIIFVSKREKDKVQQILPCEHGKELEGKSSVISMGVDIEKYKKCRKKNFNSKKLKILWIGRIVEIKGLDILLKAMEGIDDFELNIAGDGYLRKEMEELANKLNVKAKFYGYVSEEEKIKLFSLSHILIISSKKLPRGREEGVPVSLLEGLASGLLIIASRTGGIAEVIENEKNGFLFEDGNFLELREKLLFIKNSPKLIKKIVRDGTKTAENLSWEKIIKRFLDLQNTPSKDLLK